ncbi:hypothetical protein SBBP2_1390007 [Burkholderiales bacterium]|nr:hypothetical protein SBBP2_1390007 [Burkholderiales bacterium]
MVDRVYAVGAARKRGPSERDVRWGLLVWNGEWTRRIAVAVLRVCVMKLPGCRPSRMAARVDGGRLPLSRVGF